MVDRMSLDDIILFFVVQANGELPVTKLMKLVFLADVEHQQLYGEQLSNENWTYYQYGPFTQNLYASTEALETEGLIACMIRPAFTRMGKNYSPVEAEGEIETRLKQLTPKARRALANVLKRYGQLTVDQIKRAAYETKTMKSAHPGERLNLSVEPRRASLSKDSRLEAFIKRAPTPVVRDLGDSQASTEEDLAILDELGQLRREANQRG
jgi:uncharacterized phage-associated protein